MAYFAPNMHEPMANEPRRHRREVEEPVQVIVQPDPDRDRLGNTDWCRHVDRVYQWSHTHER